MREITVAFLRRAAAGDRGALREVLQTIQPVVQARAARALLRHGTGSGRDVRQEVEDLTQQVFLTLFANDSRVLLEWDPSRGLSFLNFVGLIAEREVITIASSRKKSPWTEEPTEPEDLDRSPDSSPAQERVVASREMLAAVLDRVRERMNERGLDLVQWLMVEARPIEEICAMTGMTPEAVYAWRSRLGRLAREVMNELASNPTPSARKPPVRIQ